MEVTLTGKVWISGANTYVVTIPKGIAKDILKIKEGDHVQLKIEKISTEEPDEPTQEEKQIMETKPKTIFHTE